MDISKHLTAFALLLITVSLAGTAEAEPVRIGLNYDRTGPYAAEGLDQLRASEMAVEEINEAGGILGHPIELLIKDSMARVDITQKNLHEFIDLEKVKMVYGGAASSVAIAAGKICEEKKIPFFGTLTYANANTVEEGHRHAFRECYSAWMSAKVLAYYLNKNFVNKKYYYITSDYSWGASMEDSLRKFTRTTDTTKHKNTRIRFPNAETLDFKTALEKAATENPDILVLVLFGKDMTRAVRIANQMGLKKKMKIVVPNLTLSMAEGGGPQNMEGVIGAIPWTWQVPDKYKSTQGKEFVNNFVKRYNRYPDTSGASAYTILYEYKNAVERAKSFDDDAVVKALEGHSYTLLKDTQTWRDFDHQSLQTVFAVKCKPMAEVLQDEYQLDYFQIIGALSGEKAAPTKAEWDAARKAAGKPTTLENLN